MEEQGGYFTGLHLSLLADGNVFMLSMCMCLLHLSLLADGNVFVLSVYIVCLCVGWKVLGNYIFLC